MPKINEAFVRAQDEILIGQGVKLHARPFHVLLAWMNSVGITGNVLDPALWDPLNAIYRTLYPGESLAMPAMFEGGVAIRDRMYRATVAIGYGRVAVEPLKCIQIAPAELEQIFKHYPDQGWRALYAVTDLWDFAYGVDDVGRGEGAAARLLTGARSALAATARILQGETDIHTAVQSVCLTTELSLKGVLAHRGWTKSKLRKLGHDLPGLADAVLESGASANDNRLRQAARLFPDFVGARYVSPHLTRVAVMTLAMRAQFVAGEALRRLSGRDLAGQIERTPGNPPRPPLW